MGPRNQTEGKTSRNAARLHHSVAPEKLLLTNLRFQEIGRAMPEFRSRLETVLTTYTPVGVAGMAQGRYPEPGLARYEIRTHSLYRDS